MFINVTIFYNVIKKLSFSYMLVKTNANSAQINFFVSLLFISIIFAINIIFIGSRILCLINIHFLVNSSILAFSSSSSNNNNSNNNNKNDCSSESNLLYSHY